MKQHHLKALLAVVRCGTIRAAARQLSLSQAALTKALKELELLVGTPLLARSYRGVQLTEAGRILHDRARIAEHQLEIAQEEIKALSGWGFQRISVGVTPMVALAVLADTWKHFRRLRPDVRLSLQEGLPAVVVPALMDGALDFAVAAAMPGRIPDGLDFELLVHTDFCVVGRRGHPRAASHMLEDLLDCEWILSMHAGSYSEYVLKWIQSQGHAVPQKILDCSSMFMNWQLIRHTNMLTVWPRAVFDVSVGGGLSRDLQQFPVELPQAPLGLLRLKQAPLSAAAGTLADLFRLHLGRA